MTDELIRHLDLLQWQFFFLNMGLLAIGISQVAMLIANFYDSRSIKRLNKRVEELESKCKT